VTARSEAAPRPVWRYVRTAALADLLRAADLFGQAPDGYRSWMLRHTGPAAFVADHMGLPYGHAARLVWDAFEEGLLVVQDRTSSVEDWLLGEDEAEEADRWVEREEAYLKSGGRS
jgi:hypothetical protein